MKLSSDTSVHPNCSNESPRRLNIGCGRRFHAAWTNIDLEPSDPSILPCDITQGLPFESETFDVVYHSHVLEHLAPESGRDLVEECFRILKPAGILRIVVPDLEQIAKLYLDAHREAWTNRDDSHDNYDWMKLELLDQMVRNQSGGQMGRYMTQDNLSNADFVRSRLGDEFLNCLNHDSQGQPEVKTFSARIGESVFKIKKKMTRRLVRWIMGREAEQAFEEGLFRRQGEVHRWMYDRYSLKKLCETVGFHQFSVFDSTTSLIPDFQTYELDAVADEPTPKTRKPDSLFAECVKP